MGYIITYVTGTPSKPKGGRDHYEIYCDKTGVENKKQAEERYKELQQDPEVYTAQLCLIIRSTDPQHLE